MTFDVIKKRMGNFPSGWALNGSQKTLLGSAFLRLRFPFLLALPAAPVPCSPGRSLPYTPPLRDLSEISRGEGVGILNLGSEIR